MWGMTSSHGLPALLATGAATVLLAACGGSGGGGNTGGKSDDSTQLAFAACLRKAGIDAPDPQRGPNGELRSQIRVPSGISPQRMQRIQRDCMNKSGFHPKPPSKAEQARFLAAALKFARCMRAHGVDIPDPQPGNGGIVVEKRGSASAGATGKVGPDPTSPSFKRAQNACQSLMPGPKGAKGGPMLNAVGGGPGVTSAGKP
jgi:hypothetical protein